MGGRTRLIGAGAAVCGLLFAVSCSGSRRGAAGTTAAGASSAPTSSSSLPAVQPLPPTRSNPAQVVERVGEGWLELAPSGRKVVHVKGTPWQRGYQYGYLLRDEVEGVFHDLYAYVQSQAPNLPSYALPLLSPAGSFLYRPYFSAETLEELRGMVAGMRAKNPVASVDLDDLVFVNALIDVGATVDLRVFKCSSLAVWGSISAGGKVYQTRNVDLSVGTGLEKHAIVAYAKPAGGVPYVNPGWAGFLGCASGLNAHGIGVGQVWAFSKDRQLGRPWPLTTRELLATGSGVEDAIRLFQRDRRTYGSNFVFADPGHARQGVPRGIAIESTAQDLAVFEADDPKEDLALWNGQPYGIRIPDAVFRGDCALDPAIRARQTASNGPSGDPRTASAYQDRYQGQADAILAYVHAGIPIGKDECIQISRQVAMPSHSLQCCVYENSDLELWVANARIDGQGALHGAYQEPYEHHSLDYFTPTLRVVPDSSVLALGSTLRVALPLESLGRERGLDVALRLETPGGSYPLGTVAGVRLQDRATPTLTVRIPAGAAPGAGALVADLLEAGTQDLVDVARADVTLTP